MSKEQSEELKKDKPAVTPVNLATDSSIMSISDWMIIILITMIPVLNLIMFFVWAFSKNINPNQKNWAIANLLWMAAGLIVALIFMGAILGFARVMFGS